MSGPEGEPAWVWLEPRLVEARTRIVPVDTASTARQELQLSEASTLGAIAGHTGGVVLADGWVRLLGGVSAESPRLPSLAEVNHAGTGFCQVAVDVLGGVFVLDGGALGEGNGGVHYFAPDSLEWEPLDIGYTAFVESMCAGSGVGFYADLRWDGSDDEVAVLAVDQGIAVYPFLWTEQSRPLEQTSRRAVPLAELVAMHVDLAGQLNGATPVPSPSWTPADG